VWVKRALVHNVSPAKMSWKYEEADRKKRVFQPNPFEINGYLEGVDEDGARRRLRPAHADADRSARLFVAAVREDARRVGVRDRPLPRDAESLRKQAKKGDYGIYKNLDQITGPAPGATRDAGRTNRLIAEYWTRDRLIVVANHDVVIRDDENPYWHGDLPFVAMVLVPDLRRLEGISVVETIAPLQRALWRSAEQRLDMSEIVLNPPIIQCAPGIDRTRSSSRARGSFNEFGPDAFHFETPVGRSSPPRSRTPRRSRATCATSQAPSPPSPARRARRGPEDGDGHLDHPERRAAAPQADAKPGGGRGEAVRPASSSR
jgi:hypothetical protein